MSALISEGRFGDLGVEKSWTLKGSYDPAAKNSFFGMALAFFIAAETFGNHHQRYSIFFSTLVILSGFFIATKAIPAKSILGLVTTAVSLIWIAPLVSANVFYSVDLFFMLAHSALSLLVAVGAFSYLKN